MNRWIKGASFTLLLALAACSQEAEQQPIQPDVQEEVGQYPKTITLEGESVTIERKPEKILPLSLDVAEIVMQLTDGEGVVAISKGIEDPYLSTNPKSASKITEHIASAVHIDPEQILSYETDLLLLTKMHGQEQDAYDILRQANVPILAFETMRSMEAYRTNLKTIGKAIGEEEKANNIVAQMEREIADIQEAITWEEDKPSVLVLSEVGPGTGPYMMGPGNVSQDIIEQAKAIPAVQQIGLERSAKAEMEQVLKMDPDYIILLDWQGEKEAAYEALLNDAAWQTLRAVKEGRIKVVEAKYFLNPNAANIEGLRMLVDWLGE